jgi:flagellar L-ring protein precursor FlgH
MKLLTGAIALCLAAVAAGTVQAGSIWNKSARLGPVPYSDDTARRVGDLLTIVISERSVIDNETNRTLEKKDERSANVTGNVGLLRSINDATGKIFTIPNMNLKTSADSKFDGKAGFDSDRSLTDRVTVTVEDILPNGNLVVLGTRKREVDGDLQTILVSGMVRPSDIAFDNSVPSSKVSEFHIVYKNKGPENRFTKPGWLAWILNLLNPF